jgi:hypothetical protein
LVFFINSGHRRAAVAESSGREDPNEQLLFHGTTRACLLGEDAKSLYLCNLSDCLLCNIIRNSFDVEKCGKSNAQCAYALVPPAKQKLILRLLGLKHNFTRFGKGIYSSACSSSMHNFTNRSHQHSDVHCAIEAQDYSKSVSRNAMLRVMLVNRVIVGKPYRRHQNAPDWTEPPPGFDSVRTHLLILDFYSNPPYRSMAWQEIA